MCWKRQRRKRNKTSPSRGPRSLVFAEVSLLLCTGFFAVDLFAVDPTPVDPSPVDKVTELQQHFDRESRASDKIKTLERLADAQFEVETRLETTGNFSEAALIFEKYRDNLKVAFELLKKQEPDAEKHSTPYRHLELQARRGIREAEQTLLIAPFDLRPPLEIVRKDIVEMDDELIHLLFPRRTRIPPKAPVKDAPPPEAKP
jgi:hypothetical protein